MLSSRRLMLAIFRIAAASSAARPAGGLLALRGFCTAILGALSVIVAHGASPSKPVEDSAAALAKLLVWDAMEKSIEAKPGDESADFVFSVTNKSENAVEIVNVRPSCGCTVAELPEQPWILAPGASGAFRAKVDFQGKIGKFTKTIYVTSTLGTQMLSVVMNVPDSEESRRARNQQLATADRQAVFRGDCASCHVAPTIGKSGGELFQAACGICHTAEHRASMVPDLAVARVPRDAEYWRTWISDGKERSLMPAFAERHGGPLNAAQIESLIAFMLEKYPAESRTQ